MGIACLMPTPPGLGPGLGSSSPAGEAPDLRGSPESVPPRLPLPGLQPPLPGPLSAVPIQCPGPCIHAPHAHSDPVPALWGWQLKP